MSSSTEKQSTSQDSMEVFLALRSDNQPTSAQTGTKTEIQKLFEETETGEHPEYPDHLTMERIVSGKLTPDTSSRDGKLCLIGPKEEAYLSSAASDFLMVRQLIIENKCMEVTMMLFLNPILQKCLSEKEQLYCVRLMNIVLCGPTTEVHRAKDQFTDFFYEFENYKNAVAMGSPHVINILKKMEEVLNTIRQQIRTQYLSGTHVAAEDQAGPSQQTSAFHQNGSGGSSST
ncbi:hypothetical protein CAEBREN_09196 [Caenorhabditis brenneri]|uniref:Uncharacterized protein n=1 Tax=Caenorhabditis brenneri TaxID=135651 RepID=G0N1W0_CAEBE|nr:hypothetical protein CAEBREN_09196 [Caenorhabditis brenneri]